MASISLSNVSKRFGSHLAIPGISLEVDDGEFLVLLGPSGCGKSTLLRMLAGLETVSGGEIRLDGRRVDQLPPSGRDMAFVFQSYALYPHMTVRRNIAFPLVMRRFRWWFHIPLLGGLAKRRIEHLPEIADLVERTARTLSLTQVLDRHPRTLSGGQRQRVALGRAMVRQPEVFLMDEPLSNLDAKLRTAMRGEITRLHGRVGGTFVYVTHDQVEAMTMGTRVALMRDGVVQQFGTPREIHTDPANTFVARFIGTPAMNLIEAVVNAGALQIGELTLKLPEHLMVFQDSGPVLVGLRPSSLSVMAKGGPETLTGTVGLVEHVGDTSVVALQMDGVGTAHHDEGEVSGEVTLTVPGYSDLRQGDVVGVNCDLSEAVLFSPEGGQRLRTT